MVGFVRSSSEQISFTSVITGHLLSLNCLSVQNCLVISAITFFSQPDMVPDRILFARGNVDKFVLSLPSTLGEVSLVHIWLDNSGSSPEWFLDYIAVRYRATKEEWQFTCYRWIALDKDDCKIETKLYCENNTSDGNFQSVFRSKTSNNLYDNHVWLSTVTKRPGSRFTRIQRVTCCMSVALSSMLANAMFYNFGNEAEATLQIGPLKISPKQIIIGIQSCLIVTPVNLLIVWIFQNSKGKRPQQSNSYEKYFSTEGTEATEDEGRIPHCCVYIAWFLSFGTIMTSAAFTFFYSLMWGKEKANQWLTSILVSLIQDIFAMQPIKVIIVAIVVAFILTKGKELIKKMKSRKYMQKVQEYRPEEHTDEETSNHLPSEEELNSYKEEKKKLQKFRSTVRETAVYIVFIMVMMVVCYGSRDYNLFLMTKSVRDDFKGFREVCLFNRVSITFRNRNDTKFFAVTFA